MRVMRKRLGAGIGALLLATGLATARADTSHVCLWAVDGGAGTVYLQASIHFMKPAAYPLDARIDKAYADSDVIVFETDIGKSAERATQLKMMALGRLPEGQTLKSTLRPETYRLTNKTVTGMGLDMALLQSLKPWFLALQLTSAKLQSMGFSPIHGIDMHFYQRAKADEKPTRALESVDYQLQLLDSLSTSNQDAQLAYSLNELGDIETQVEELMSAWSRGDLDRINDTLTGSFDAFPRIHEALILKRNRNWMPEIESFLADGRTHMVIVGAAHLAGKGGLLDLLKEKGYRCRQL